MAFPVQKLRLPADLDHRLVILQEKVVHLFSGIYSFEQEYTGLSTSLGTGRCENTPLAAYQMCAALAMTVHPVIDKMVYDKALTAATFNATPLRDAQVLKGKKILDLGCGRQPTFARCSRVLGAEVYTVDIISAAEFEWCKYEPEYSESEKARELEHTHHLGIDLNNIDALEEIIGFSGGDFDLVTEAHLKTGAIYCGREYRFWDFKTIAMLLLREGGVLYTAEIVDRLEVHTPTKAKESRILWERFKQEQRARAHPQCP